MAKLTVTVDSSNEAFSDGNAGEECARIVRRIADALRDGQTDGGTCRDINGNKVGSWEFDAEVSEELLTLPAVCIYCGELFSNSEVQCDEYADGRDHDRLYPHVAEVQS